MSIQNRLEFVPDELPLQTKELRERARKFFDEHLESYSAEFKSNSWCAFDKDFSKKMGANGFIGLTMPKEYGGAGLTNIERYVVVEEALYTGAPVGFHWIADRQSAPLILKHGTEEQKQSILPGICRGEIGFCIGLSEPNAGSDLASLQARAQVCDEGWRLNGTKLWTTGAHVSDYMIGLFRSQAKTDSRHQGLTQFVIDLKNTEGITIRPIQDLAGHHHFNEVIFEDALLPVDALLGTEGQGWKQAMQELAIERSGPERFLSCMVLFTELLDSLEGRNDPELAKGLGRILGELITLRNMSISVTSMLNKGEDVSLQAAIVKDLGADFEQRLPSIVQQMVEIEPSLNKHADPLSKVLANLTMIAPSFSLRGGTVEILRGIIAKGMVTP